MQQSDRQKDFHLVIFEQVYKYKTMLYLSFQIVHFLEVLGALLSVLTIWLVTGVLVYMAIERCINQTFEVQPLQMIIVASCGVAFNIV